MALLGVQLVLCLHQQSSELIHIFVQVQHPRKAGAMGVAIQQASL